jgi:hypothetical protein
MSATVEQIEAEKNHNVDILDRALMAAQARRNDASESNKQNLDDAIDALLQKRDEVLAQAYERQLLSSDMKNALATLKQVTSEMTTVAARMTTATETINAVADLLGLANTIIGALKN